MFIFAQKDPIDLIKELEKSIVSLQTKYSQLSKENDKLKTEAFKDEEFKRLREAYAKLEENSKSGFAIFPDENKAINAWIADWFKRKRGGDKYMGAIGGGFTYSFTPTGIGTIGKITAPDGEEFKFRDI